MAFENDNRLNRLPKFNGSSRQVRPQTIQPSNCYVDNPIDNLNGSYSHTRPPTVKKDTSTRAMFGHGSNCPNLQSSQLPLLITGIAGVAGYNAFFHFRKKYGDQVIGLRTVNNWPLRGDGIIGCDIEDEAKFKSLIEKHQVRTILNCGGSCALKACELDPDMAQRVNVLGIKSLLNSIERTDIQLVHCSIDLVFSGKGDGNYVETDDPDPVTVYGRTMVDAERLILDRRPSSCILRISLPMGVSFNGHAGAIDWIQSRFAKQKPATLYFDEVRTPTYVECLNETVEEIFARRLTGLFHAGGPTKLSLYQIAQIVNRIGGYDPDLLIGCPRIDAGPIPPRAGNVTMNSEKLEKAIGRKPFLTWPFHDDHHPISPGWHFERGSGPTGSAELVKSQLYLRPRK
jgi:dTDP-4-dehydrorhamnose reductase